MITTAEEIKWEQYGDAAAIPHGRRDEWALEVAKGGPGSFKSSGDRVVINIGLGQVVDCLITREWVYGTGFEDGE